MRTQHSTFTFTFFKLAFLLIGTAIVVSFGLSMWHSIASSQPVPSPEDKRAQFLRDANANRLKRTTSLAQMNESSLAEELRRESLQGIEPFNSFAYKEAIRRGQGFGLPLAGLLTAPDRSSFLGLLALRKVNSTEYHKLLSKFRVKVLVDALEHANTFNAWGLPNLRWHEAAEALIEEKDAARNALVPLLKTKDSQIAPVLGPRANSAVEKYGYRLSDYALALLNDINGERKELPTNPALRNDLIEQLARQNGYAKPPGPVDPSPPATPGIRIN